MFIRLSTVHYSYCFGTAFDKKTSTEYCLVIFEYCLHREHMWTESSKRLSVKTIRCHFYPINRYSFPFGECKAF